MEFPVGAEYAWVEVGVGSSTLLGSLAILLTTVMRTSLLRPQEPRYRVSEF